MLFHNWHLQLRVCQLQRLTIIERRPCFHGQSGASSCRIGIAVAYSQQFFQAGDLIMSRRGSSPCFSYLGRRLLFEAGDILFSSVQLFCRVWLNVSIVRNGFSHIPFILSIDMCKVASFSRTSASVDVTEVCGTTAVEARAAEELRAADAVNHWHYSGNMKRLP